MRFLILAATLLTATISEAHNYGCYVYPANGYTYANYQIVRHADGTFWSTDGSLQYEEGAIVDYTSPTGFRKYYYALPFKPTQSALQGYRPLATPGNTIYGYSETTTASYAPNYQQSAAVYQIDAAQLTDQATRLASQSLELAQTGQRSAAMVYSQQIELAKVQATGIAAAAALQAAKGPAPESVQRAITLTLQPDATGHLTVRTSESHAVVGNGADPTDAFMTVVGNNCAKCHAASSQNADARKHLRLEDFAQWDAKTFAAISTAVEGDKMPPHKPLSRADKAVIYAMESFVNAGNRPSAPDGTGQRPEPPNSAPEPPASQPPLPPPPPVPATPEATKPQ